MWRKTGARPFTLWRHGRALSLALLLLLPMHGSLAQAQFTFTKVADVVNTGSVPQRRPFLVNGDVIFNGFGPAGVFNVPPTGDPYLFLVPGTPIPGAQGNFNHVAMLAVDGSSVGFHGFNDNNESGFFLATPDGVVALAGLGTNLEQPSFLMVDGGNAAFITGQFAVGAFTAVNAYRGGQFEQIAVRGTPLPGGAANETFQSFSTVDISGNLVLFPALGDAGTQGIYYQEEPGQPIKKLFDTNDPAPGGMTSANYLNLFFELGPVVDQRDVLFQAEMSDGREAIFLSKDMGVPIVLAEKELGSGTTLPGGPERVDRLDELAITADKVAFIARDENRQTTALFVADKDFDPNTDEVTRVVGTGDNVNGRTMGILGGSPGMLEGNTLAFGVEIGISANEIYRTDNLDPGLQPTGLVRNGSFDDGLNDWMVAGQVELAPIPAADLTSDSDPGTGSAQISQAIDTPGQTFWIRFDTRFTTTSGSVDLIVNGLVVAAIPAPGTILPSFQRHTIKVNNSNLMDLAGVNLGFRLNPGSLSNVQITSIFSPSDGGESFNINAGLNDAWNNPVTDGQGFLIAAFPVIKRMFVAWFTYDSERPPETVQAMLGEPGHRWLTAQGPYEGDTANLTIYLTEGGVFDSTEPATTTDPGGYGTMTIEFADCSEALVSYQIPMPGLSGEIPISRIVPDNVSLCESLNAQ